jgi:hypothetical protein
MLYKFVKSFYMADPLTFVGKDGDLTVYDTNVAVHDGVTPGGFPLNSVKHIDFYLTSEMINASNNPITILPAFDNGSGNYLYVIDNVAYTLLYGTVPFSGGGSGSGLWYGSSVSVDTGDSAVFSGSATVTQQSLSYSSINNQNIPTTLCATTPVTFWSPNNPYSGGNGTGIISFNYYVVSLIHGRYCECSP